MSTRGGDSPYEVLGIRPSATLDEAEAAYRARLRRWHPDLHAHAGPDAVTHAEHRTRKLNEAIRSLRAGARVRVGAGASGWDGGSRAGDATDSRGPRRDGPPFRCVFCGTTIREAGQYRTHLLLDHAWADRAHRGATIRPPRLAWLPAPTFWALIVVIFYWSVVFAVLGDSALAMTLWWSGVAAYLLFLPVAYRAERYRRRF